MLALAICLVGMLARVPAAHAAALDDGVYEVQVTAYQATKDEASMCDKALVNPAKLTVSSSGSVMRLAFQPLKTGALEGYLGRVSYFPGYSGSGLPDEGDAVAARVVSTYAGVTDDLNGPESSDSLMRGVEYPKEVELSWDGSASECFLRVYVPVMNAISPGSGWQFVRLAVDYGSAKPVPASSEAEGGASGPEQGGGAGKGDSKAEGGSGGSGSSEAEKGSSASGSKSSSGAQRSSSSSSSKSGKGSTSGQTAADGSKKLEFAALADGSYTVEGSMVKIDRKTTSMADAAIDHAIALDVEDGTYRLTVKLGKVTVGGQASYLGKLSYFKTGYSTGESGEPKGKVGACKVVSYQMEGAKRVSDDLGTDYPAEVQIPLIPEAKKGGYVPLRAFVPAMEAIAAGTGTQPMYLKLDTASVAQEDAQGSGAAEAESGSSGQQDGSGSGATSASGATPASGGQAGSGSVLGGSTLPVAAASPARASSLPSAAPSGSGGVSAILPKNAEATPRQETVPATAQVAGDSSAVSITGLKPVDSATGDAAADAAAWQDGQQPPLKNALVPAALVGCGVVALGAGSALFRRREWLFD